MSDDIDLGQSYGAAQITKREKDGKWVAMFASGYNNVSPGSGLGRLFVVDLETGGKLSEIVAPGDASPEKSGIAWVNGWTNAGMDDNTVQHVYAGDLSGNIWRFDINADTVSLLASVGSGGGTTQPVTSRVELGDILDSSGGQANQRAIYVGTGRYLGDGTYLADPQDSDILNTDTQSFYAIRDDADDLKSWGNFRAQAGVKKFTVSGSGNSRKVDYDAVLASGPGWYLDFDVQSGERVVINPRLFNGDQKTLTVVTSIPSSSNMCEIGGTSYVYMLETKQSAYVVAECDQLYRFRHGCRCSRCQLARRQTGGHRQSFRWHHGDGQPANHPGYQDQARTLARTGELTAKHGPRLDGGAHYGNGGDGEGRGSFAGMCSR